VNPHARRVSSLFRFGQIRKTRTTLRRSAAISCRHSLNHQPVLEGKVGVARGYDDESRSRQT
jgi:hypothetical protein